MNSISSEDFIKQLSSGVRLLDVRSPSEFKLGSIPNSINIPILDDQERHEVGFCYKQQGQSAAIELGYKLVSGDNLQRKVSAWMDQLAMAPETIITCFRGGLRSQSTQKFLLEKGIKTTRLREGYKSLRTFFIDHLSTTATAMPVYILSGTTGSGKTHLLNQAAEFYPTIDLEGLAHHRGSAFGAWDIAQPSQIDFENRLSLKTLQVINKKLKQPVLLEDESRMIGICHIPESFFLNMRSAPVILVKEAIQQRIENIFVDYISSQMRSDDESTHKAQSLFTKYKNSVQKIQKKLGGLRAAELLSDLQNCESDFLLNRQIEKNKIWIEKLLIWYYDPMYTGSLEKRNPQIQFQGTSQEIKAYLKSLI